MVTMVISGGQTGADRAGLEIAKELGITTGGTAPRGYRTENGPDLSLKEFGLVEAASSDYPTRTKANVMHSDTTVWFGNEYSPGGKLTRKLCEEHGKPFYANPTPDELYANIILINIKVLNVAGNRASKNPDVVRLTKDTLKRALA